MESKLNNNYSSIIATFENISFRAIIEVFFVTIFVIVFLKSCVIEFYKVESGSMEPELFKNDIVVLSRLNYFFGLPSRFPVFGFKISTDFRFYYKNPKLGDIVVIDEINAPNLNNDKFIIKRITGIPGDSVIISETAYGNRYGLSKSTVSNSLNKIIIPKTGDVININNSNLNNYINILICEGVNVDNLKSEIIKSNRSISLLIKNNYYFIQGDNQLVSSDSRMYGLIPQNAIVGKAIIMFLSGSKKEKRKFLRFL